MFTSRRKISDPRRKHGIHINGRHKFNKMTCLAMLLKHRKDCNVLHNNLRMLSCQYNPLQESNECHEQSTKITQKKNMRFNWVTRYSEYLRSFPPVLNRDYWIHFRIIPPFFCVSKTGSITKLLKILTTRSYTTSITCMISLNPISWNILRCEWL